MVISNRDLMTNARTQLHGKWGSVILVMLVYILVCVIPGSIPKVGWLVSLIIGGPFSFGLCYYFLSFSRDKKPLVDDLFKGFSVFGKTLVTYLLMLLFIILWTLLLIVPGIIAAISYSMTFYLMADNNELSGQAALAKSKELMNGNKYRYFCLMCRFIGWFLLSILTLGIGFLWLVPYFMTSNAKFYENLIQSKTNPQPA